MLVIPAHDEELVWPLERAPVPGDAILVVNEPRDQQLASNVALLARYRGRADVTIMDLTGEHAIVGGVGEARARGFERALTQLADRRSLETWIRTTDADVELPRDYFAPLDVEPGTAACLFPFVHIAPDPSLQEHVDAYEASLRYYVLSLAHACSPYAFHTVGSTLAISATAYRKVHGFPKRQAGEDFYILNKLAKVGGIETLKRQPLRLSGRASKRVPFGTGPSVAASVASGADPWERVAYHPQTFVILRDVLRAVAKLVADRIKEERVARSLLLEAFQQREIKLASCEEVASVVLERLTRDGTLAAIVRASRERNQGLDRLRAVHTHFDAFRTLKLVHALRDGALGTVPLRDALQRAPWLSSLGGLSELPLLAGLPLLSGLRAAEQRLPSRRGLCSLRFESFI